MCFKFSLVFFLSEWDEIELVSAVFELARYSQKCLKIVSSSRRSYDGGARDGTRRSFALHR